MDAVPASSGELFYQEGLSIPPVLFDLPQPRRLETACFLEWLWHCRQDDWFPRAVSRLWLEGAQALRKGGGMPRARNHPCVPVIKCRPLTSRVDC